MSQNFNDWPINAGICFDSVDPRTGAKSLAFDPLDFVAAALTQIPDAKKHLVRNFGGYSHRMRATVGAKHAAVGR